MDNLIVFMMSALIAFVIPLFAVKRASHAHVEKLLSLYNQHDATADLRNVCMLIGAVIAIIVCTARLNKFHMYSMELSDNKLKIISYNLVGKRRERIIDLKISPLVFEEFNATKERDPGVRITLKGFAVFSTEGSKYWNIRKDRGTLYAIKEQLSAIRPAAVK